MTLHFTAVDCRFLKYLKWLCITYREEGTWCFPAMGIYCVMMHLQHKKRDVMLLTSAQCEDLLSTDVLLVTYLTSESCIVVESEHTSHIHLIWRPLGSLSSWANWPKSYNKRVRQGEWGEAERDKGEEERKEALNSVALMACSDASARVWNW